MRGAGRLLTSSARWVQPTTSSIRNARCESRGLGRGISGRRGLGADGGGLQDGRGRQISFVVKVFFVVAGPRGGEHGQRVVVELAAEAAPGARPQQAYPLLAEDPRGRLGAGRCR